jgi:hypothetical protein
MDRRLVTVSKFLAKHLRHAVRPANAILAEVVAGCLVFPAGSRYARFLRPSTQAATSLAAENSSPLRAPPGEARPGDLASPGRRPRY